MVHSMANNVPHKLSHTMIRGRTYYTNFRLNDSTSFVRLSLGTDSHKQAEVIMNQIRPYIPLVQNGTMGIEEFKRKIQGYRAATKQDFDSYLLRALERDVAEVERLPELGQSSRTVQFIAIICQLLSQTNRFIKNPYCRRRACQYTCHNIPCLRFI